MKISFLLTTIDAAAGTERAIITQANSLASKGHEVDIFSVYRSTGSLAFPVSGKVRIHYWVDEMTITDLSGGDEAAPASYGKMPSRLVPAQWDDQFSLLTDLVIERTLPKIDADILVTTTPALGFLAGSLANSKTVVVAQEHRASMRRGRGFEPLKRAASQIDCIVSLTDASNNWLSKELQGTGVMLKTIPNVLPDLFRPQSTTEEKMILAAGRLAPGKQFGQLIDAFGRVYADYPDWTLRIYGSGPLEDSLKNQAVRLNIAHAVQIVPPVKNLELEWPKAGLLAITSRSEGLPLVIMEAAGAGVPTISYDCLTGPAELIEDGISGLLVPINNVGSMSQALDRLMGDNELRQKLGQAAKKNIGDYSPTRIDDMWDELYSSLLTEADRMPMRSARSAHRFSESLESFEDSDATLPMYTPAIKSRKNETPDLSVLGDFSLGYGEVLKRNRAKVDELLRNAGTRFREVVGYHGFRAVLAIPVEDRLELLEEIEAIDDPTFTVELFRGSTSVSSKRWFPAVEPAPLALKEATMLRFYGRFGDAHELVQVGAESAVELEFWQKEEESEDGHYRGPRHNRVFDTLEAFDFAQLDVPVPLPVNTWSTVRFPIDVVYTWVDGGDPEWKLRKAANMPSVDGIHEQATSDTRFTSRDELRYSIRSLRRYAPWVRNIFLVTDDQTPGWLANESDIKVISHRELFPDAEQLPTFNSHAIETTLHRIPELAEHFLYCNDDTVFLRLQTPETYFTPNGLAKFFPSPVKINYIAGEAEPHIAAAKNNRAIIRERFDMEITQSMLHTPHPHRKSVLAAIEEEQPEAIARTRGHRFRDPEDVSFLSSLGQYYGYGLQKYVPGSIRYTYVGLGRPETESRLVELLNNSRLDVATFGESNLGYDDPEETDRQLHQFFESKFPLATNDELVVSPSDQ